MIGKNNSTKKARQKIQEKKPDINFAIGLIDKYKEDIDRQIESHTKWVRWAVGIISLFIIATFGGIGWVEYNNYSKLQIYTERINFLCYEVEKQKEFESFCRSFQNDK